MVLDKDLASPPSSPSDGDRYIVAASPIAAWAGQAGNVAAWQDGAWAFYTPRAGWLAWVGDETKLYIHDGSVWGEVTVGAGSGAATWGINATADTTNRLAVKSPATLLDNVGNGHQQKINKAAAGDTASQLFQTAYSGRAEFGLTGDDDFHVKVSADGSSWVEAIVVDRTTGAARLPATTYLDLPAASAPATPASGKVRLYAKTDKLFYQKDDAGAETGLAGGGGTSGVPSVAVINGKIVESHAGNAATFALKTLAGADPSSGDPVTVIFPDGTTRSITAALSVTLSSGSTAGFTSGAAGRLWFVLFDDAGTIRLGVRNCSDGSNVYGFAANGIGSSTAEGGAGGADSAGVTYTGTAVASKPFVIVALAEYDSGLTTAGTWDASPSRISLVGPGTKLPGAAVQALRTATGAVASGSTGLPSDDTIPQNTEGDQYMSLAITPKHAGNVLRLRALGQVANGTSAAAETMALFQDSTANALAASMYQSPAANYLFSLFLEHLLKAGTTSSTTFKIRIGGNAGTTTFNGQVTARLMGGVANSFLSIEEIVG
jgi:uncharacterized protein DUF2793